MQRCHLFFSAFQLQGKGGDSIRVNVVKKREIATHAHVYTEK